MRKYYFLFLLILSFHVHACEEKAVIGNANNIESSSSADFQQLDPAPFLTFYELFLFCLILIVISVVFCYPLIWSCIFAYEDSLTQSMFSPFQEFFHRIDVIDESQI